MRSVFPRKLTSLTLTQEDFKKNLPGEPISQETREHPPHCKQRGPAAQNEDTPLVSGSLFDQTLARPSEPSSQQSRTLTYENLNKH